MRCEGCKDKDCNTCIKTIKQLDDMEAQREVSVLHRPIEKHTIHSRRGGR